MEHISLNYFIFLELIHLTPFESAFAQQYDNHFQPKFVIYSLKFD